MNKTITDRWLDELVLCGHSQPVPRRQALEEMVLRGMDASEAVNALCHYKQVLPNGR